MFSTISIDQKLSHYELLVPNMQTPTVDLHSETYYFLLNVYYIVSTTYSEILRILSFLKKI